MAKAYDAILCDPRTATVETVTMSGDWQEINKVLECDTFTAAYPWPERADSIYCDDDGLWHWPLYTVFTDGAQPYAGPVLIVGVDDDGNTVAPAMTLDDARALTSFHVNTESGLVPWSKRLAILAREAMESGE